jgi:hypothetical protein
MAQRAELEAEQLAARIIGNTRQLPAQPHIVRGFTSMPPSGNYELGPGNVEQGPKA